MGEEEGIAGVEAGGDHVGVEIGLDLIGHEDHDHVGPLGGRFRIDDLEPGVGGPLDPG